MSAFGAELTSSEFAASALGQKLYAGRAQYRETVSQALKRIRHVARILRSAVYTPKRKSAVAAWAREVAEIE
jgi:hypothetical protein